VFIPFGPTILDPAVVDWTLGVVGQIITAMPAAAAKPG
jgi:hypothetical protein